MATGFDWDSEDELAGNSQHVMRKGLDPSAVEEVFANRRFPALKAEAYSVSGELREAVLGETEAGTLLRIVFTRRSGKIRPISLQKPSQAERRRWNKVKRGRLGQ